MALLEKLLILVKRVEGVKIHEESTVMSYLIENQFSICRTFFPLNSNKQSYRNSKIKLQEFLVFFAHTHAHRNVSRKLAEKTTFFF